MVCYNQSMELLSTTQYIALMNKLCDLTDSYGQFRNGWMVVSERSLNGSACLEVMGQKRNERRSIYAGNTISSANDRAAFVNMVSNLSGCPANELAVFDFLQSQTFTGPYHLGDVA